MRRNQLYWLLQIIGWLVYVLLAVLMDRFSGAKFTGNLIINILAFFVLGIVDSHIYRNVIIRNGWFQQKFAKTLSKILISCLILSIAFLVEVSVVEAFIYGKIEKIDIFLPSYVAFILRIASGMGLFLLWSLLYFLFHFVERNRREEMNRLHWEAVRNELELNKLKSQLNPHFIFNSMNSIRALIEENPEKAKTAITDLSNILRSSLLIGKQKVIDFEEEMEMVQDYLSLEKIRFEERLEIDIQLSPEGNNFKVPPMMIQTLVENAVKHGISQLPKGGILSIQSSVEGKKLKICIENDGQLNGRNMPNSTGFGLKSTNQRLALLYGEEASFSIVQNGEKVKVELMIPQALSENKNIVK